MPEPASVPRLILRLPDVKAATGLSESTIKRRWRAGDFPAPVRLGARQIGWRADEIEAWVANRPRVEAA